MLYMDITWTAEIPDAPESTRQPTGVNQRFIAAIKGRTDGNWALHPTSYADRQMLYIFRKGNPDLEFEARPDGTRYRVYGRAKVAAKPAKATAKRTGK